MGQFEFAVDSWGFIWFEDDFNQILDHEWEQYTIVRVTEDELNLPYELLEALIVNRRDRGD
jgi:hypothetical protein